MRLDPRILGRLADRRVLLVDDVISTGRSALAALDLLARAGCTPVALCVAMAQGDRWRASWPDATPVVAAFATPLFRCTPQGWVATPETLP
jgi:adenine/guanine phosphoribosyltransferase-like PRPP-binding protein